MKTKNLKFAIILFLGITVFESCKKGENDPAISLKSRDGRITGEWKLTESQSTDYQSTTITGGPTAGTTTSQTTENFNGSTMTTTTSGGSDTESYSLTVTIEKDGTCMVKRTKGTSQSERSGRWSWLNDAKNKTRISIDGLGTYTVDQLKNKELVLINVSELSNSGTTTFGSTTVSSTTVNKFDEKLVFEKQ
jgi:hypothetical protein